MILTDWLKTTGVELPWLNVSAETVTEVLPGRPFDPAEGQQPVDEFAGSRGVKQMLRHLFGKLNGNVIVPDAVTWFEAASVIIPHCSTEPSGVIR